jgi:hypothetical protein
LRGWAALLLLFARSAGATTFIVAESGGDFAAIQPALDVAMPGDTVRVHEKPTPYVEKLVLPRSGARPARTSRSRRGPVSTLSSMGRAFQATISS